MAARVTFDVAPKPPIKVKPYFYGGAELLLSDRFTVDVELGFSAFREDHWSRRDLATGEAVIRLKLSL